jgi:hypothetical protein
LRQTGADSIYSATVVDAEVVLDGARRWGSVTAYTLRLMGIGKERI